MVSSLDESGCRRLCVDQILQSVSSWTSLRAWGYYQAKTGKKHLDDWCSSEVSQTVPQSSQGQTMVDHMVHYSCLNFIKNYLTSSSITPFQPHPFSSLVFPHWFPLDSPFTLLTPHFRTPPVCLPPLPLSSSPPPTFSFSPVLLCLLERARHCSMTAGLSKMRFYFLPAFCSSIAPLPWLPRAYQGLLTVPIPVTVLEPGLELLSNVSLPWPLLLSHYCTIPQCLSAPPPSIFISFACALP